MSFFRTVCGRTPSDPIFPYDPLPCECGIRTSAHLLSTCSLLDHTRSRLTKKYEGNIDPSTICQSPGNTKAVLAFLKSTRLGYHSNINYDPTVPPSTLENEPFTIPPFA
jgi:hypothetical protein